MSQTPTKQTPQTPSQEVHTLFRAKSAGVSLVIVFAVGIYYFINMLELLPSDEALPNGALSLITTSVILVIIVEIVLQIVLAIGAGKVESASEQYSRVNLHASRNAHLVLRTGVVVAFLILFAKATLFMIASVLLLSFFAAEIVRLASQIFYYRRLA